MYDVSGEGWVKHILYGTSKILQLRGPDAHLTGPGRSFFLTVRVFEICRSLIYSEPTFLCEPSWRSLMSRIWDETLNNSWHPKEVLFDLMITCSTLSNRYVASSQEVISALHISFLTPFQRLGCDQTRFHLYCHYPHS